MNSRYNRQILLPEIGHEGQKKLNEAKVLVIGAGGLGCPALQYLAGAGIGHLGIIDHDVVSLSNLHRQILFNTLDIGKNKAVVACEKLQLANDQISIHTYPFRLDEQNAINLFSLYDIVLDCTDNIPTRYLINDACLILDKIYVYGAIHTFEGQVAVFNYKNGPNYRDLFPTPPSASSIPTCNEIGVLGVLPGIIGTYQANETLKIILNIGDILGGKIYSFNALTMKSYEILIRKTKTNYQLPTIDNFSTMNYNQQCGMEKQDVTEVIIEEITKKINDQNVLFVDVREINEQPAIQFENLIMMPMSEIGQGFHAIPKDKEIILFCRSGQRSLAAANYLQNNHSYPNIKSLKSSIFEFVNFIHHVR